jgi:hypothetical protein
MFHGPLSGACFHDAHVASVYIIIMKKYLFKSIMAAGLMSLSSALWALAPNVIGHQTAWSITATESTTIEVSFYANSDWELGNEFYGEDKIVGYDVYVDGYLVSWAFFDYARWAFCELTFAGSDYAPGTHSVDIYAYTESGDSALFSTTFSVVE